MASWKTITAAAVTSLLISSASFAAKKEVGTTSKVKGDETPLALGLQGGLNFSSARVSNPVMNVGTITEPVLGAFLEIGFSDMFFLQPELNYVRRGASVVSFQTGNAITIDYHFNYVELPLLAKIKLPSDKFKPYAFVGPNIGFLVNADADVAQLSQASRNVDTVPNSSDINFGIDVGAGAEYPITETIDLCGSIRYNYSFQDSYDDPVNKSFEWRHDGVMLMAGIKIGL